MKRVWTEQWPFHSSMRAFLIVSASRPPNGSCGSHTGIRSSGTPIL